MQNDMVSTRRESIITNLPPSKSAHAIKTGLYPPRVCRVDGILPDHGAAIIAGSKGSGKTFLAYQLIDAITAGKAFLGRRVLKTDQALYVQMELSEARSHDRFVEMNLQGKFDVRHAFPNGESAIEALDALILTYGYEFVVIDTLQRVFPRGGNSSSYDETVAFVGDIRELGNRYKCMIVMLTHTTKASEREETDDDWTRGILGSTGIIGCADAVFRIFRKRGAPEAVLKVMGNDLEDSSTAIKWRTEPEFGFTLSDANPAEIGMDQDQRAIIDALRAGGGTMKTGALAKVVGIKPDNLIHKLERLDGVVKNIKYGVWALVDSPTRDRQFNQFVNFELDVKTKIDEIDGIDEVSGDERNLAILDGHFEGSPV